MIDNQAHDEVARPVYPALLALAAGWWPQDWSERVAVRREARQVLSDMCDLISKAPHD